MPLVSWLECGVVVAVVTGAIDLIKHFIGRKEKKDDKKDSLTAAIRFCLLGEFERYGQHLTSKGNPPTVAEFHRAQEMYGLYKALGGDGYADALFESIKDKLDD